MRHGLLPSHETIQPICERPLCVNPAHAQPRPVETLQGVLTSAQIQEVRALIAQQFCPLDVAQHFGVAVEVIRQVVSDASTAEALLFAPQVESHPHAHSSLSERERRMLAHRLQERANR